MRMHRAAKVRHNKTVEECIVTPKYRDAHPQQFHIQFYFSGEATSLLTLTRHEAKELFETLGVMLRFEDTPACEIDTEVWADTHRHMRKAITNDIHANDTGRG